MSKHSSKVYLCIEYLNGKLRFMKRKTSKQEARQADRQTGSGGRPSGNSQANRHEGKASKQSATVRSYLAPRLVKLTGVEGLC